MEFAELTVAVDIPDEEPFPAKQIVITLLLLLVKGEPLDLDIAKNFLTWGTTAEISPLYSPFSCSIQRTSQSINRL